MDKIDLTECYRFTLIRERDGIGDSGLMLECFQLGIHNPEKSKIVEVGKCVRVGTIFARTFSSQDWWQTTHVASIDEHTAHPDGSGEIKFVTENGSIYTLKYS